MEDNQALMNNLEGIKAAAMDLLERLNSEDTAEAKQDSQ
jgi:hypothetical protein